MTTTLMFNPEYRGLQLWRDEWLHLNAVNISRHEHKTNKTTMHNGDVYLWMSNTDHLRGLLFDVCMIDDRCSRKQYEEFARCKEILRTVVR